MKQSKVIDVCRSSAAGARVPECEGMIVCPDCGHVAVNSARHAQHVSELRHVNTLRFRAYR